MTRYFKVVISAGAFQDGVYYPPATDHGDNSASIVPLEIGPDERAPLWGVETDANGNELKQKTAKKNVSPQDRLATEFANKIATDAGAGAINDGDKEDEKGKPEYDEGRKQAIIETLNLLDHSNDEDWTQSGLPQVGIVAKAAGLSDLTRAEIDNAAPEFKREKPTA